MTSGNIAQQSLFITEVKSAFVAGVPVNRNIPILHYLINGNEFVDEKWANITYTYNYFNPSNGFLPYSDSHLLKAANILFEGSRRASHAEMEAINEALAISISSTPTRPNRR